MRVLLVDGHPAMRLGIQELLSVAGDMRVVGEMGDGEEALRLVNELRPDLIVLGLNLTGDTDGIEVCQTVKASLDPPRVLVHTAHNFTDDVSSCLLAGADSYLHKRSCCEEVLDAVRRTAAGERVWSVGGRVGAPRSGVGAVPKGARLTPKEREVLVLMLCGCSNAEMVERLVLGLPTVRTHVRNVLRKLGAKSRKEILCSRILEA